MIKIINDIHRVISILIILCFSTSYNVFGRSILIKSKMETVAQTDSGVVKGIKYKFFEKDNYYSFIGEFTIDIDYDCLINVSFNVEHKRRYNKNVSDIELIKSEDDRYVVKYMIEKLLIVKNTSYWMLRLHSEEKMITYKMISNRSNMKLYDVVKSSRGFYKFIAVNKGYKVIYMQETYLEPGFLMKPYRSLAKDEAIKFMSDFKKYLKKNCK